MAVWVGLIDFKEMFDFCEFFDIELSFLVAETLIIGGCTVEILFFYEL